MKNKIVYDGRTFEATDIKSGSIHRATSLLSRQLEADTITVVVKSEDTSLTEFTRGTPLYYYHNEKLVFIAYIQSVSRVGPNKYKLYGTSAIGRLIEQPHEGGIYTGQTAEEVIKSICGPIPVEVKQNLKGINLYGWLPYAKPPKKSARDNLAQVLFAIGATVKVDLFGVLKVENLWDGISGTVKKNKIYTGANVQFDSKITTVSVFEHQYVPWDEETKLFEGTAQYGDIITFSEPIHSLSSDEFIVLDSGANWAKVSAGTGTLKGKKYFHSTREIVRTVGSDTGKNESENAQSIEDATLVSLVNSIAVTRRMADFYRFRERVNLSAIYQNESTGDRMAIYHPFDRAGIEACLESADITVSNVLKSTEKFLVGFIPPTAEAVEIFDEMQVISESGPIFLPNGVREGRFVLISGGQGGQAGYNGENGGSGTSVSSTGGTQYGQNGKGGQGGQAGEGGEGGSVYVGTFTIEDGDVLIAEIGQGGAGGSSNGALGSKGGATKLTIGSSVYSSEDGSSSPMGYTDVVTGKTYATPGGVGIAGAPGGAGESRSQAAQSGSSLGGYLGGGASSRSISASSRSTTERTGPSVSNREQTTTEVSSSWTKEGRTKYNVTAEGIVSLGTTYNTVGKYASGSEIKYLAGPTYTTVTNGSAPTSGNGNVTVYSSVTEYSCSSSNQSGLSSGQCRFNKKILWFDRTYTFKKYTIEYAYGNLGNGGGGAAAGSPGSSASSSSGGSGASASSPSAATTPGNGGQGGNGGGGAGGGGAGAAEVTGDYNKISHTAYGSGGSAGVGGRGSAGGKGAKGLLILYYGVPKLIRPGQLVDKNNRMVLDRLGRRIIV